MKRSHQDSFAGGPVKKRLQVPTSNDSNLPVVAGNSSRSSLHEQGNVNFVSGVSLDQFKASTPNPSKLSTHHSSAITSERISSFERASAATSTVQNVSTADSEVAREEYSLKDPLVSNQFKSQELSSDKSLSVDGRLAGKTTGNQNEENRWEFFRIDDSSFFAGHAVDASSYTLREINVIFKRCAAAVFITWVVLIGVVYKFTPAQHFRRVTPFEQRVASMAAVLLLVSLLTKWVPTLVRGWKHSLSGVMVAALTVQGVAILTDLLIIFYPIPIRVDPVTNIPVHLPRWCEFVPLSFMMLMLTEGVGTKDVSPGAKLWPVLKIPVLMALSQALSTFAALLFPFCRGKISWGVTMLLSILLFLLMYPRLYFKWKTHRSFPKGSNVHSRELYNRARFSYRLMALCTAVFSTLVAFYFISWAGSIWGTGTFFAHESLGFFLDTLFEALSKVMYLSVIIEIHVSVFDEGQRASRLLEELRQMMSVVWESSSDVVAISVKGWDESVTTMFSPTFLKLEGIMDERLKAVVFEQSREELSEYLPEKGKADTTKPHVPLAEDVQQKNSSLEKEETSKKYSRCYCLEFDMGQKVYIRDPVLNAALLPSLDSIAELIGKSWAAPTDEILIMHNLVTRGHKIVQCEAKVTRLKSNSLVVVVRDISDRCKLFDAEKQAILELTARTKDAEANRFTRHEVKNGLLAAMALCENVMDSLKGGEKISSIDSFSKYSAESLANLAIRRKNRKDSKRDLRGPEKAIAELDDVLHDILDTVLSEAMARDVIHECYSPKLERVDVRALLHSHCNVEDRYQIITSPNPLPICISDPQLLKYIHTNAMTNAVTYGKQGGPVLTEIIYDECQKRLVIKVTNIPGENYDKIRALGKKAEEDAFMKGKRLHSDIDSDNFKERAMHSSGDGAWIAQKCAKTLGGHCNICFDEDRTIFSFECPITTFELTRQNIINNAAFELPKNTIGIAIDDSNIQRKLMSKVFTLLGIPEEKQIVKGANAEEIGEFIDTTTQLMKSDPSAYYLLIADENLDVTENLVHHKTVSGSALVQKLREGLDPDLERRMLALVRSANDSSTDIALYMARAHGFFPKGPVKKEKVYEILAPMWLKRFPESEMRPDAKRLNAEKETEMFVSSAADLMQTVNRIEVLCKQNDVPLHQRWPVISDNLHVLKGDLLCLQPSHLTSHALQAIDMLRNPLPPQPQELSTKWWSIKALVENILKI